LAKHPELSCLAPDCNRGSDYRDARLCQKHYFRKMRNGHFGLKGSREPSKPRPTIERRDNGKGYQMIHSPGHPLVMKNGYAYEHRLVIYNVYGDSLPDCEICQRPLNWTNCHVDHINENVGDNRRKNLRPICRGCNTERGHSETSRGRLFLTIEGKTLTSGGWSRQEGVRVSASTIIFRKKKGLSDYDAVFMAKKTHISTKPKTVSRRVVNDPRQPAQVRTS